VIKTLCTLQAESTRANIGVWLVLILFFITPTSVRAQQLWFSPGDDLEVNGVVSHPDYPALFRSDASWKIGSADINVLQSRPPYLARTPQDVLQSMLSFLREHNIDLAVPIPLLPSDTCGRGVEGILPPRQIAAYVREMKDRSVDLKYVVMDEPLFFGHDYSKENACHLTVPAVAEGVAQSVRVIRGYYPQVKFILVEPEQSLPGGPEELSQFLDAYSQSLHELPISVRFDVQWHRNWQSEIPPFISVIKQHGIGFSVIFNATRAPKDDAAWIASAKQNTVAWENDIRERPDHVMIQTWNPNPVRILPETDPTTMSGFLKWYIDQKRRN
jgi:hypothetical protein